ncbi:WXG100 family type VII secretion target [Nocardia sp. NPDC058379]|uniref:WXG100 family type VII secretion target n=1 Tax=unclassified Nocardia TaxID=2637762 RepID=UPI0036549010
MTVVPASVRDVGNYVYGIADTLRQALDMASGEVDSCAGGSWAGTAASTFATGWSETREGGLMIIAALTTMAEKLGVTAETYTQRDESNSELLRNFSLDL